MRIGTNELLIILVVALLIFGPKNLPKLGKMFGKTMNNFKKGMEESEEEENTSKAETQTEKKDDEEDAFKPLKLFPQKRNKKVAFRN